MTTLMTIAEFRAAAKDGKRPDGPIFRLATGDAEVDAKTRTARFIFSDDSIDRMGDRIDQDGWDLSDFKANPVALWAHDSSAPPVGRAANVGVKDGKLTGDIEFADEETYAFADTIFRLVKGGFVKAVSVGFLPTDYKFVQNKDRPFGIDFLKQQLLEISVCPIPANPNALQEAKRLGIDTSPLREWAEKLLDLGHSVIVPRDLLEETFRQAKTPKTVRAKYLRSAAEVEAEKKAELLALAAKDVDGVDTDDLPTLDTDAPRGNCGRTKDEDCGMKDMADCLIHKPEAKALRSGRRVSAATKALLTAAGEHLDAMGGYHVKAMDCIKAAIDGEDKPDDTDSDTDKDKTKTPVPDSPEQQLAKRRARAAQLRETLGLTE